MCKEDYQGGMRLIGNICIPWEFNTSDSMSHLGHGFQNMEYIWHFIFCQAVGVYRHFLIAEKLSLKSTNLLHSYTIVRKYFINRTSLYC